MKTLSAFALVASFGLASCSTQVDAAAVLSFSAIPDQNSTELQEKYDQLGRYLSDELGVEVVYVPSTDYEASVEAFKGGDVQLAWFGGLTGVQARAAVEGARAIAQGKVDPLYKSYFIAHADAGVAPSQEFPLGLAGKTFTFGSRSSTSGRLMPEHFVRENTGQSPAEFFAGTPNFSGSHDKTAELVQARTFQSGALNYKVYDSMVDQGKLDPTVAVKVWETPGYPDYNWTAHPSLDETFGSGFVDRLQAALVRIEDPALLLALQRPEGLIAATNADFQPLVTLARDLNLLR